MHFPPHVVVSTVDDELVVMDTQSGTYYGLNAVGARMVALLQQYGTVEETVKALCAEYDAGADRIRADVVRLVDELERRGLVGRTTT